MHSLWSLEAPARQRACRRLMVGALPACGSSGDVWWDVLGIAAPAGSNEIEAALRRLARVHHPDMGEDVAQIQRIVAVDEGAMRR